jgi:hypothetical protein
MDHEFIAVTSAAGATVAVVLEYLDLDDDGVADAVRIRRAGGDAGDERAQVMALR